MIKYYRTMDHQIHEISEPMEGTWISLIHPTAAELAKIATDYKIDIDDLRAPLDEEERSHIEVEEGYTLFIVDVPTTEERKEKEYFLTIPCGIILTEKVIITVCLEDTAVLADFKNGRVRNFWTFKRTRFILQILYRNASLYLQYLRIIDKKSDSVEKQLHISTKNQELIELLELEKSLVYFSTSLRSNELVLEKMLKIDKIKQYPEDEELLDDVIIENKQAIGRHLQQYLKWYDGCIRIRYLKQPEYCNEGSCDHNDRYVDSDDDREFLGNECSSTTGTFSTWIFDPCDRILDPYDLWRIYPWKEKYVLIFDDKKGFLCGLINWKRSLADMRYRISLRSLFYCMQSVL